LGVSLWGNDVRFQALGASAYKSINGGAGDQKFEGIRVTSGGARGSPWDVARWIESRPDARGVERRGVSRLALSWKKRTHGERTMATNPRLLASMFGILGCSACITVQAPQCPATTPSNASVPPAPATLSGSGPRVEDESDALTQLHVLVSDIREGARIQAHCTSTACPSLVSTFNQHFNRWLASARGQWLVITVVGDKTGLPLKYHADYLPEPLGQIRARMELQPSGRLDRVLGDGTHVVVLYGKDEDALLGQIDQLTFDTPQLWPEHDLRDDPAPSEASEH
jgi:hypothetical protein